MTDVHEPHSAAFWQARDAHAGAACTQTVTPTVTHSFPQSSTQAFTPTFPQTFAEDSTAATGPHEGSPEEMTPEEISPEDARQAAWIAAMNKQDLHSEMAPLVEVLASCPGSFRTSPDFAFVAGFLYGRAIALDDKGRDSGELKAICRLVEHLTLVAPASQALLLALVPADLVYSCLVVWAAESLPDDDVPWEEADMRLLFLAASLLGLRCEGFAGTKDLGQERADLLFDLIASMRRSDASMGVL